MKRFNHYPAYMNKKAENDFKERLMTALKRERKARNLSHDKLSALSGVSRQAISKIESGERNPTMLTVYKLISALDIDLCDFMKKL